MRILHRYLIFSYLWPLGFCTLLFLFMFVFIDSLTNLDEFIKNKASFSIIGSYYLTMIPIVLIQILPAASLMSALYFLGQLNRRNEITAMKASGISGLRILIPILLIGAMLSFFTLTLQERVIPQSSLAATAIKRAILQGDSSLIAERALDNVAILSSGQRMIYAREFFIKTNTLHKVIVLEHYSDFKLRSE